MRISDWSSDVCSSDLGVAVFQHRRLFGDGLLYHCANALALGEPTLAGCFDLFSRVFLVEREIAANPAIRDAKRVQKVEHPRPRRCRIGSHRNCPDEVISQFREKSFLKVVEIGRASCWERVCKYV